MLGDRGCAGEEPGGRREQLVGRDRPEYVEAELGAQREDALEREGLLVEALEERLCDSAGQRELWGEEDLEEARDEEHRGGVE